MGFSFRKLINNIFGEKVNGTHVTPITTKVIAIFVVFLVLSNVSTNFLNLIYNRFEIKKLTKQILVKDLKTVYSFCNDQYEIFNHSGDMEESRMTIEEKASIDFKNDKSMCIGIYGDGSFFFQAFSGKKADTFDDDSVLTLVRQNLSNGISSGKVDIQYNGYHYFSIYKYNSKWNAFIFRGEEVSEFNKRSRQIFSIISLFIFLLTCVFAVLGVFAMRHILRYLNVITEALLKMNKDQELGIIALDKASNDEITFMGMAVNSLSSTVKNLVDIFKKFANKDIAEKAYEDRYIQLDGTQKQLTCLFSDIRSFTTITETLGKDIIALINLHYNKAINEVVNHHGLIGSIIGDAILAVFGADTSEENKSVSAVYAAYGIQDASEKLRMRMHKAREKLLKERGKLTEQEEKIYKAVLIEVGVGLDGGDVFYGNIGSDQRMTNTVIGDNVNASARLEGLTRIYNVPVICSDYVKHDIENSGCNDFVFVELDTVKVKGKTVGQKIYWPIVSERFTDYLKTHTQDFSSGLRLYYDGAWKDAMEFFQRCELPLAEEFRKRIKGRKVPSDWNGIWTMTSK